MVGCSNRDRDTLTQMEKEKNRIGPHISLASTPLLLPQCILSYYITFNPLHPYLPYVTLKTCITLHLTSHSLHFTHYITFTELLMKNFHFWTYLALP